MEMLKIPLDLKLVAIHPNACKRVRKLVLKTVPLIRTWRLLGFSDLKIALRLRREFGVKLQLAEDLIFIS